MGSDGVYLLLRHRAWRGAYDSDHYDSTWLYLLLICSHLITLIIMTIITSLLTGVEYDTDIQRVSENQIVIFFGYAMRQSRYVVCRVEYTPIGYTYTMLDPDT